jgi:alcohol dehydrogenase
MKGFEFTVPQHILFGAGVSEKLAHILAENHAEHVLLISDRGLQQAGLTAQIESVVCTFGVECTSFLDVLPNPTVEMVHAATALFLAQKCDFIVALGGGSPMDVAKAAAVVTKYGGSITDYEGADRVPGEIVPIAAIPTTAGTGSEVTAFSVITDTVRSYKLTVFSYRLIPKYAILDSLLILTLPQSVAAATGIDAAIHAIEAYLSRTASPFSDAMAEKALELIGANLRPFVACRQNAAAADAMLSGSLFAGIAFSWARLGNVHAMSHPVSAYFGVPHGVANAVLLPVVLEYNALADAGRYERIRRYLFGNAPGALSALIWGLLSELGISSHLADYGVTEDRIPQMAADAMKSGNILSNPRQSTQQDIEELYRRAM